MSGPELAFVVSLTLLVFYLWTDNLVRCVRLWRDETHDRPRAYRSVLIAVLIWEGMLAFLVSALSIAFPDELTELARFVGLVVRGSLLVVGLFTFVSWRRP